MHHETETTEKVLAEKVDNSASGGVRPVVDFPPSLNSKYENLGMLGAGGMAVVYKARHRVTEQMVAIKVLSGQDDLAVVRFMQEAKTLTSISHPNIVVVHDFDSADNTAYLVMELVEGRTLADVLREEKTLSVERLVQVIEDVCQGLAYAHQKGVVHRDIKPSNILLKSEDGREVAKIADFGIAKQMEDVGQNLTQTGEILGTPLYMSPEQCMGQPATKLSDIYALGCVMYKALAGVAPLAGSNMMETAHLRATQSPKSFAELKVSGIPRHIEAAVMACLERDVNLRTSDPLTVAEQIRGKRVVMPKKRPPLRWLKWLVTAFVGLCTITTLIFGAFVGLVVFVAHQRGIPVNLDFRVLTSQSGRMRTLMQAGRLAEAKGELPLAEKSFELLLEVAHEEKSLRWEAVALWEQAKLEALQNHIDAAVDKMKLALSIGSKSFDGKGPELAKWYTSGATFFISLSRYPEAEQSLHDASHIIAGFHGPEREIAISHLVETYRVLCERTGKTPDVPSLVRAIDAESQQ